MAVGAAGSEGERVRGRCGNSGGQTRGGGGTFSLFLVSRGANLVTYSYHRIAGAGSPTQRSLCFEPLQLLSPAV